MRALLVALLALLVLPQAAAGARYAVGARTVEDLPRLERALGGRAASLAPLPALVVERNTAPRLRDLPGALAKVTECLAEANANIVEVHHQRAFTHLPVLSAEVEFVLQTRGPEHVAEIVAALERAGFGAEVVGD